MEGEKTLLHTQVTTGGSGYRTPLGTFAIMRKRRVYQSTVYGSYVSNTSGRTVLSGVDRRKHYNLPGMRFEGAQMNYYLEFASGIGMHAGDLTPYPSSHGCVRLPVDAAKKFFELLDIGCIVRVQTTGRPLAAGATRSIANSRTANF
jgi:lipoprotein-anchoring transpeptidase ErfK/SrfK